MLTRSGERSPYGAPQSASASAPISASAKSCTIARNRSGLACSSCLRMWGKESRFGLPTGKSAPPPRREPEVGGACQGIRCAVGVDMACGRRWLWTSRVRSRAGGRGVGLPVGPSRGCDRNDGCRRTGARVRGSMRRCPNPLGSGRGCEGSRGWAAAAGERLSSAVSSGAGPSRDGRLGSAATAPRPSGSA
jgi:hypothetical protein